MLCKNNYDPTLVAQFYATVHFSSGVDKSFTWMSRNNRCTATLAEFAALLGYRVIDDREPCYYHCHSYGKPMTKDRLEPLYMEGTVAHGFIKYLLPTWDIMNRIIRETIAPKVGNVDQIHGFQVDFLVKAHENKGKGLRLDVMDFLWNEMTLVVTQRRVPSYCPYVMALIESKSTAVQEVLPTLRLIEHKEKHITIKDHPAPDDAPRQDADAEIDPGLFGYEAPPMPSRSRRGSRRGKEVAEQEEPSWAKRLFASVQKLICFTNDINDRQYDAYKLAMEQDKKMHDYLHSKGRNISAEPAILPREQWISPHYFVDDATSSHREPPPQRQSFRRAPTTRRTQSSRPNYAESSAPEEE